MGLFDLFKAKKQEPAPAAAPAPVTKKEKDENIKNFKVAGISFHEKDLMKLSAANEDYSLVKSGLIKAGLIGKDIYQYVFPVSNVELIPEPDNKEDPNAVKVVVDGTHIGYIKKGNCSQVKNLMSKDKIDHLDIWIGGGKYKRIDDVSGYDEEPEYELESGETEYSAKVTVYLKA